MSFLRKDAQLRATRALPAAAATVNGAAIKLDVASRDQLLAEVQWLITAPALAVGQLANGSTMKYSLITSPNSDGSSPTVIYKDLITQTGAGGAGAAAATSKVRLPADVTGYVGLQVINSAAADASAASATIEAVL